MTTVSMTWVPRKRESGNCYDVASENGIRCNAWPIGKLCHAKVLASLMLGIPDDAGDCAPEHKLAILRVHAMTRAFFRFADARDAERSHRLEGIGRDRSRALTTTTHRRRR